MNKTLQYLLNRLQEPSTWKGISALASFLGVVGFSTIDYAQAAAVSSGVYFVLSVVLPDKSRG